MSIVEVETMAALCQPIYSCNCCYFMIIQTACRH